MHAIKRLCLFEFYHVFKILLEEDVISEELLRKMQRYHFK